MPQRNNVLCVNEAQETEDYREAVAEIIRRILADHHITLTDIANSTGISFGTISNAANKKGDLTARYLHRLGKRYGCHYLDPAAALADGRYVPKSQDGGSDILPSLMVVGTHIAQARSPASEGGTAETLREQLGYLPYLRRHLREVEALIHTIEERKDAA